jgi:hypothetical protein
MSFPYVSDLIWQAKIQAIEMTKVLQVPKSPQFSPFPQARQGVLGF